MKKTIVACMALAYAGLAFSEPAILTEAKNYKLSNGQTMEQVLANYSHCDQKEWGVVDNRAIFVCRDQGLTNTIAEIYKYGVDQIYAVSDEMVEIGSKRAGISKEQFIKNIEESKKNPRVTLARQIELMNSNKKAKEVVTSIANETLGVSSETFDEAAVKSLKILNVVSTKEDFLVVYFDRENGHVVASYADMHYWTDVNGKINYKGASPAVLDYENRLIKNIPFEDLSMSDEDGKKIVRTLTEAYTQAEAKAKKELSK